MTFFTIYAKKVPQSTCFFIIINAYLRRKTTIFHRRKFMANLTISLDDEDKKSITKFCDKIGITVSGLYNVFTKQVLREGRIPFEIGVEVHSHITTSEPSERQ